MVAFLWHFMAFRKVYFVAFLWHFMAFRSILQGVFRGILRDFVAFCAISWHSEVVFALFCGISKYFVAFVAFQSLLRHLWHIKVFCGI
jgi:hypothetical protein